MSTDIKSALDQIAGYFPAVKVLDDLTVEIVLDDRESGEPVRAHVEWRDARALMADLLRLFDPSIDALRTVLHRHGLTLANLDNLPKDIKHKLPETFGGFYVQRDQQSQWYFGRPVNRAVYFEKCSLQDLIDLGVKVDDVKRIATNVTYRVPFVGELRES